jgi:hypothetical protein
MKIKQKEDGGSIEVNFRNIRRKGPPGGFVDEGLKNRRGYFGQPAQPPALDKWCARSCDR